LEQRRSAAVVLGFIWPLVVLKLLAVTSSLLSFAARPSPMALHAATPGGDTMMFQPQAILPARATSRGWLLGSWALGAAATDMLAWMGWTLGSRTEYATVVTALASLFSVVTILLAWMLLRERLAPGQWMGIAVILLGILLVGF
jgi:drug/metabolite transporter (DMT)-like permease